MQTAIEQELLKLRADIKSQFPDSPGFYLAIEPEESSSLQNPHHDIWIYLNQENRVIVYAIQNYIIQGGYCEDPSVSNNTAQKVRKSVENLLQFLNQTDCPLLRIANLLDGKVSISLGDFPPVK